VFRICDILVRIRMRIRILGVESVPLFNESGNESGRPVNKDPDADPEYWYIYIIQSSKIKGPKMSQNSRNQGFFLIFLLDDETTRIRACY
jgi:hypothetical protein